MRIAVLVYDLNGIGGIAKHALHLSHELYNAGHQVDIWSIEYNKGQCYPELTEGLVIQSLRSADDFIKRAARRRFPGLRMLAYLRDIWNYYREQQRLCSSMPDDYDVINPHGNIVNWAAVMYKRRYGTSVVWMCNDFVPIASHRYEMAANIGERIKLFAKKILCAPFTRFDEAAVHQIDRIAVLSELVNSQMVDHYGVKPVVVRTGVNSSRFVEGDGHQTRKRYDVDDETFLLLTVCVLMPRRRIEDVIQAVRVLVNEGLNVVYHIVGRTSHSPTYTEFLKSEVETCGLSDRVKFIGQVSEDELLNCYQASNAFVWNADESQSWGMAGLEAMAVGKPIIVSKANGLAEVLEDEKTALLVSPRSPKAIAEAIKQLMTDPFLAKSVGNNGQKLVRERYSWNMHAKEMLALFHEAIGR